VTLQRLKRASLGGERTLPSSCFLWDPMPFTFFAHQAAVLPLKLARPRWFCGTALAIGSMAPDLEYFIWLRTVRYISHSLPGQVLFCLPVTLLLVWLVMRVIARPLALHLPDGGVFHLRDYRVLALRPDTPGFWPRAAASALVGSLSHIAWDSFTHLHGWPVQAWAPLRTPLFIFETEVVYGWRVLQHGSTLFGGLIALWLLARIGRDRLLLRWSGTDADETVPVPSPQSRRRLWTSVLLGTVAGVVAGLNIGDLANGWATVRFLAPICFGAVTFTFLGLCVGCALAARVLPAPTGEAAR